MSDTEVISDETDRKAASVRKRREEAISRSPTNEDRQAAEMNHLQLDRTIIKNPQTGKAYRLVNRVAQDGARIQVLEGSGYKVTPSDDPAKLLYGAAKDGGQVHGDLILMETDQSNYDAKRERERRLYQARLGESNEASRERMEREIRDSGHGRPHKSNTFDQSGNY